MVLTSPATVFTAPRTGLRSPKYSPENDAKSTQLTASEASAADRPRVGGGRLATRRLLQRVSALLNAHAGANTHPGGESGGVRSSV